METPSEEPRAVATMRTLIRELIDHEEMQATDHHPLGVLTEDEFDASTQHGAFLIHLKDFESGNPDPLFYNLLDFAMQKFAVDQRLFPDVNMSQLNREIFSLLRSDLGGLENIKRTLIDAYLIKETGTPATDESLYRASGEEILAHVASMVAGTEEATDKAFKALIELVNITEKVKAFQHMKRKTAELREARETTAAQIPDSPA